MTLFPEASKHRDISNPKREALSPSPFWNPQTQEAREVGHAFQLNLLMASRNEGGNLFIV